MIWVGIFTVNRIIMHYDDLVLRLYGPTLNGVIVCAAASGCESLMMVGFPRVLMRMCSRGLVAMAPPGVVCFFLLTQKETNHSPSYGICGRD